MLNIQYCRNRNIQRDKILWILNIKTISFGFTYVVNVITKYNIPLG